MDIVKIRKGALAALAGLALMAGGAYLFTGGVKQIREGLEAPAKADVKATDTVHKKQSSSMGTLGHQAVLAGLDPIRVLAGTIQEVGRWEFTHRDARGRIIWHAIEHNGLSNVGQQRLLEVYFKDATEPSSYYLGLADSTSTCSVAKADSTATAFTAEPSTNGYARVNITRDGTGFPTSGLSSGDWHVVTKTATFTASGGSWGPVYCAVLATSSDNTGDFLAWAALSTGRTLASGETLDASLDIKLQ